MLTCKRTLCFDFLELPLELRETIYELVLMSSSGKFRRFSSPGRHKKSKAKPPRRIPTSILLVSRQLYFEARNVLYRETACKLSIYLQFHQVGYHIERKDKIALTNFRQVNLNIHVTGQQFEYDDKAVGLVGRFLADLVDILGLALDSRYDAPTRTVKLDFRFREANDMNYQQRDADPISQQSCIYRKVWYRAQIASAVNKMRKLLRFRAPGLGLITNVETSIFGFRAQKLDARKVRFQNESNGEYGIFELWGNGLAAIFARKKKRTRTTK